MFNLQLDPFGQVHTISKNPSALPGAIQVANFDTSLLQKWHDGQFYVKHIAVAAAGNILTLFFTDGQGRDVPGQPVPFVISGADDVQGICEDGSVLLEGAPGIAYRFETKLAGAVNAVYEGVLA